MIAVFTKWSMSIATLAVVATALVDNLLDNLELETWSQLTQELDHDWVSSTNPFMV